MPSGRRVFKIAERIQAIIASELERMSDPRLGLVTITSVSVSPDLRHAKVYWIATGGQERIPDVEEAFESSAGLFRRALGKGLGIRFVPEVRFYYDDTFDVQDEVNELMSRIGGTEE